MTFLVAQVAPSVKTANFFEWTFAAASLAGVLAGVIYRAGAALVLSMACALATLISAIGQGWSLLHGVLIGLGLIAATQLGYLLGVGLTVAMQGIKGKAGIRSIYSALFKRDTAR